MIVCPTLIFRSTILQVCSKPQHFESIPKVGITEVELASKDSATELEGSEIVAKLVDLVSTIPYLLVSFVFGLVAVIAFELVVIEIKAISGSAAASVFIVA